MELLEDLKFTRIQNLWFYDALIVLIIGLSLVLDLIVHERVPVFEGLDNWWSFVNYFRLVSVI